MKGYEGMNMGDRLNPDQPSCMRLDGRCFSKFTRAFSRPFDPALSDAMRRTTRLLMEETQALAGYTQSDEITLVWDRATSGELLFDGRLQKLVSTMAAKASVHFAIALSQRHPEIVRDALPGFDARAWNIPGRAEAANCVLWRALDARKNGISTSCRTVARAREMHGLDGRAMIALMRRRGLDFPEAFDPRDLNGTFFRTCIRETTLDEETLARIPPRHRPGPDFRVRRRIIVEGDGEDLTACTNLVETIFSGAEPVFSGADSVPDTGKPGTPNATPLQAARDIPVDIHDEAPA